MIAEERSMTQLWEDISNFPLGQPQCCFFPYFYAIRPLKTELMSTAWIKVYTLLKLASCMPAQPS